MKVINLGEQACEERLGHHHAPQQLEVVSGVLVSREGVRGSQPVGHHQPGQQRQIVAVAGRRGAAAIPAARVTTTG